MVCAQSRMTCCNSPSVSHTRLCTVLSRPICLTVLSFGDSLTPSQHYVCLPVRVYLSCHQQLCQPHEAPRLPSSFSKPRRQQTAPSATAIYDFTSGQNAVLIADHLVCLNAQAEHAWRQWTTPVSAPDVLPLWSMHNVDYQAESCHILDVCSMLVLLRLQVNWIA